MLDNTSKKVIQFLLNCPDYTFAVYRSFPDFIPRHELLNAIDYLEQEGYVITHRVDGQSLISATLTHKGMHSKEFNSIAIKRYFLDKWIDFLALIISIAAFIGAYRHEISAVLRLIMQALTG